MKREDIKTIVFNCGKLYINGKEVPEGTVFDFEFAKHVPVLGINVSDAIVSKDVGPGQK